MKKMSPKLIAFFMVALILFSTISHAAARPEPSFREVDPQRHKVVIGEQKGPKPDISIDIQMRRYTYIEKIPQGVDDEKAMEVDDSCDGIGEDECLMRRTLAAHTDYLYTQEQKN